MSKIEKSTADPIEIYQAKRVQFEAELTQTQRASSRLASARGLVFLLLAAVIWLSLFKTSMAVEWLLIPVTLFGLLVWQHARVNARLQKAQRAQDFYSNRIDHITGDQNGEGQSGTRYIDSAHPYTSDLDIFGTDSLFEYLSCTRTRLGEDTLALWLTHKADPETIALRQNAVRELTNHLEFREELALLDVASDNEFCKKDILQWVAEDYPLQQWQRIVAAILGVLALFALGAWALGFGRWPLLLIITLEIPLYLSCIGPIKKMTRQADSVNRTLANLTRVLTAIENKQFKSALLKQRIDELQFNQSSASLQVGKLYSLLEKLHQCFKNQLLMPFALLFGVPIQLAFTLNQWRNHTGPHLEHVLDSIGQIEALTSLATYGFEHPQNTYPVVSTTTEPVFTATALSHPLIPAAQRVPNDIHLSARQQLVMVSGSNMSGKSTLLRSIGIAAVMASCGAPVQAKHLELSSFTIGCAMRAQDSLKDGASLFYAVISRIKCVVDLAETRTPVLFLLDEILQGTNSHDRLIGAKGVIHQLLEHNAVGLVTTHDLALTQLVDSLGGKGTNVHFEDHFLDNEIRFDYKVRPGIIQKSNGLALMRMIGLRVDDD